MKEIREDFDAIARTVSKLSITISRDFETFYDFEVRSIMVSRYVIEKKKEKSLRSWIGNLDWIIVVDIDDRTLKISKSVVF